VLAARASALMIDLILCLLRTIVDQLVVEAKKLAHAGGRRRRAMYKLSVKSFKDFHSALRICPRCVVKALHHGPDSLQSGRAERANGNSFVGG